MSSALQITLRGLESKMALARNHQVIGAIIAGAALVSCDSGWPERGMFLVGWIAGWVSWLCGSYMHACAMQQHEELLEATKQKEGQS